MNKKYVWITDKFFFNDFFCRKHKGKPNCGCGYHQHENLFTKLKVGRNDEYLVAMKKSFLKI